MARYNIPKSFQKIDEMIGTLGLKAAIEYRGKIAYLQLFQGRKSCGFQSDYASIPVRIVAISGNEIPNRSWQYSGKRYDDALKVFEKCKSIFA